MKNKTDLDSIAHRLTMTRTALGLSQAEFADAAGIARNTYNQWERGKGRPQLDGAIALCRAFNLTLDWIYFGDMAGLSYQLAQKLTSAA
jgi:DNA-binding XRE family transcriptional regulator